MIIKSKKENGTMVKKLGEYSVPLLALAMLAGPLAIDAQAGPIIEFGDGDGLLKIDYKLQFQAISRDTGSGDNDEERTSTINARRNRLQFLGAWTDKYSIYLNADYFEKSPIGTLTVDNDHFSDFSFLDYQLRIEFADSLHVRLGKFKANFSRDNLEDCYQPLTLDRSLFVAGPFVLSRDRGVAVWGNLLSDKFQYRADIVEGKEAGTSENNLSSDFRFSGRVHYSLLDPETGYGYRGTYLGTKKVLTLGAAYQHEANVVYSGKQDGGDTPIGAEDYNAITADIFAEMPLDGMGTVTFSAAYLYSDLGNSKVPQLELPGGIQNEKEGYYAKAAYMLPNIPLQFFVRAEQWTFFGPDTGWTFAGLPTTGDHNLDWGAIGANYYINGQNLKLTFEYSRTDFDDREIAYEDFDTAKIQLQYIF